MELQFVLLHAFPFYIFFFCLSIYHAFPSATRTALLRVVYIWASSSRFAIGMQSRSHHSFVYPLESRTTPQSEPRRKALLIGINYKPCGKDGVLVGPHSDVSQMKHLLQNTYGYPSQNIVTMLDDGIDAALQPTRDNIMREIKKFVSDALPGDRFFFLYSGHSEQVENIDNTEEDGKDECLLPVDAKGKDSDNEVLMIRDDELKEHLVDSLPKGARLIAVFDSCHSGSLLDLAHFRCNRVFVPWTNKGRRKSDSIWNANVRDNAMEVGPTRHVYQTRRISSKVVKNSNRPLERAPVRRQRLEARTLSTRPTFSSLSALSTNDLRSTNDGNSIGPESLSDFLGLDMEFCDSPVKMWCDGWCDPTKFNDDNGADVIALASCKDDQISWEDGNGNSMTKALVKILRKEPHPSLKDLMDSISHEFHKVGTNFHKSSKQYKKELKKYRKRGGKRYKTIEGLEMDNFQDPQLSSHKPLDLNNTQWEP